ncbi:MAG: LysO family transporter [Clostridiaceae bacterium]
MWSIIVVLLVGIFIGASVKLPSKIKKITSNIQYIGVVVLLFTMGVSLGLNKDILKNIRYIGVESLTFAVLTSLFSIILVYFVSRLFLKKGEK